MSSSVINETLEQKIARLESENAALKESKIHKLGLKVSAKGAVSVYGMGKFPVTLYKEQWERLLNFAPTIINFLVAHKDELSVKE